MSQTLSYISYNNNKESNDKQLDQFGNWEVRRMQSGKR
jgi:hypothetical protein